MIEMGKLFVLDDLQGIWQITGGEGIAGQMFASKNLVFQQFGCYQMINQNRGESLILACNPSFNNYFVMTLVKNRQLKYTSYEPLQTVFLHDQLYQIEAAENILMSRVFSGVKLFWSSKQIGNPYPFFYRNAGTIFLHNAIQSKLKVINETKTIFMAAEDELLKY